MAFRLALQDFRCSYPTRPEFGPWQLAVGDGDRVGLAGPSGVGKTTLLDLLAGLTPLGLQINCGQVQRASGLRVAYISQEASDSLSPYLSVTEQVAAFAACSREEATHWLHTLGLQEKRQQHARPAALSGGERKRVQVAQALAMRADVILADEPTANLDPENASTVCAALLACNAALVVSSHQEDVFAQLQCQRIQRLSATASAAAWPELASLGAELNGLPLAIRAAELVVLRGPSGVGKTTFARRLLEADPKRVRLVQQEPSASLNPRQTISEAFAEANPALQPQPLLAAVGLTDLPMQRRNSELSEGQRARVAIARTMASLPNGGLLILDESLSCLDTASAQLVYAAIVANQRRTGLACLLVSHDDQFPAHRTLLMQQGGLLCAQ